MISLKQKSKGFTIVELLIVIVVIAILATLVIVTFTGIQQKARDSQRQTDVNALDSHLEAFYANYGFYPSLKDLQTSSFVSTYMKGLDPQALISPKSGNITDTAANSGTWAYGYTASGTSCSNTTATTIDPTNGPQDNGCASFTLTADLEGGGNFTKSSNTQGASS
ncbi:MAG TPA: type II secretion system protein [Candidatus Saccharimonadales bacterium]|jgi:prepilin-type N-terminal cleavage/methylation domain-containing protein